MYFETLDACFKCQALMGCMSWLQVKVNLNLHGVVSIVNVTQIVEEEYEESVKVSKQSAADDAPMQARRSPDPVVWSS